MDVSPHPNAHRRACVLISLINSADSIIRSKWTLSKQSRVEMGVLTTLSVCSFNNNEEKRVEIDF